MITTTHRAKRLLVITRNLPPFVGGMERLLHNLVLELDEEFDVSVIGPKGCDKTLPGLSVVTGLAPYPLWRFLVSCLRTGIRLGRRLKPDVVLAGSGLTAPIALIVARTTGSAAIAQLHGLDLVARNLLYRLFFITSLRRLDGVIVNSRNTAKLAARENIRKDRITVVNPGITLPPTVSPVDPETFRTENNLAGKRILLSVGRILPRKGLSQFILQSMPDIVRRHPNTVLAVVGAAPRDAVKSEDTEIARINDAIVRTGLHDHIRLLGSVPDEECDLWYRCSDVFVFPGITVSGDVEGFGIVAIEAAARGLPTVAFAVGGIPDAVLEGRSGHLIPPGQYDQFTDAVVNLLECPDSVPKEDCRQYAQRFNIASYGEQMRATVSNILEISTFKA